MITASNDTPEQVVSEIRQKISLLCNFNGDSLRTEMSQLKSALLENPAACSLLLDEDIGLAVASLRRMVGIAVASANAPKEKKVKVGNVKMTATQLALAIAEVRDDEL